MDRVINNGKDLEKQTDVLEKSIKLVEWDYFKKMTELNGGFKVHSCPSVEALWC